jgi:hypothetical protein
MGVRHNGGYVLIARMSISANVHDLSGRTSRSRGGRTLRDVQPSLEEGGLVMSVGA